MPVNGAYGPPCIPGHETDAQRDMAAFDDLPSVVRKALRDAPFNCASEPLLEHWDGNGGEWSANQMVAELSRVISIALALTHDFTPPTESQETAVGGKTQPLRYL